MNRYLHDSEHLADLMVLWKNALCGDSLRILFEGLIRYFRFQKYYFIVWPRIDGDMLNLFAVQQYPGVILGYDFHVTDHIVRLKYCCKSYTTLLWSFYTLTFCIDAHLLSFFDIQRLSCLIVIPLAQGSGFDRKETSYLPLLRPGFETECLRHSFSLTNRLVYRGSSKKKYAYHTW